MATMTTSTDTSEPLSTEQLEMTVSGNRLIFAMGEAEATMHYLEDGTLHLVLPGGKERRGTWTIGPGDAYTARWNDADGPSQTCFHRTADGLIAKNAETGMPIGRVLAVHPGQAGKEL